MKQYRLIRYAAPALLLGLVFLSCRKPEEPKVEQAPQAADRPAASVSKDVRIVATVNGEPITLADFEERFARAGFKADDSAVEVKEDFLNRLIERIMIVREAQKKRIKVGLPEINQRIEAMRKENSGKDIKESLAEQGVDFEKWKNDVWEDLMIERLLTREVYRKQPVSSAEVRRYYEQNPGEFEKPDQVRARQIVCASEADAQSVLGQLAAGKDFATLARQKSTAPEAVQGGDLGYFGTGDMPAEFNVVFAMQKGQISGVVKTAYGFHIFKVEDKRKAGRVGLNEAYKGIAEKLGKQKQDTRYEAWLKDLRSRTKFEVNYEALR